MTFTLVKSNGAEYDYQSEHFEKLILGQLVTLEGHSRPYFVKSIDEHGRYHIKPVQEDRS